MKNQKIIAIDLGGTHLRTSLVINNKIRQYIKKSTPKTKENLLKEMSNSISQLISKEITGIGIGSPGPLENGIIKNPPNLPLKNFNLKKYLENKFHKKVMIENDVHCVALAEARFGCKKNNFIVIALGTGIGGGIIINKKLYLGRSFAGEIGHIIIDKGKFFEKLWQDSRKKIIQQFGTNIMIKDLIKMKNEESEEILKEIISYTGKAVGSLINIFDPEIIIITGGIKESGPKLLDLIKKETKKYIILPHETEISYSKLDHPGTIGASLLIRYPR
jgi:glucokinase